MKPTPPVSPCFDVTRSCSDLEKIPLRVRFSGHRSAVRLPFLAPLASGLSSHHYRLAPSSCSSKFIS
ncbi:hypothetical protein PanWU01x14_336200, partial [Parasponia andersonii]